MNPFDLLLTSIGIKVARKSLRSFAKVDDIKLKDYLPLTVYEGAEDGATAGWSIYDDDPSGAAGYG